MADRKTVVVTGGGSGGHITPILAVSRELKRVAPETRIIYIGQTGDGLDDIIAADENIDEMHAVRAGKLRRYSGEGFRQLLDMHTMYLNIRDGLMMIVGMFQSFWLLRRLRPDAIFTRGSYVSVPVCLAGALLRIPYITHDSDAIPSLTNRIIARWAVLHAVALPEELYHYPIDKTKTVGVPISPDYQFVTPALQRRYRQELKLDMFDSVILATGGGNGARLINDAVIANAAELLQRYPGLAIVHITGRRHEQTVSAAYDSLIAPADRYRVRVAAFVSDMYRYSGAASIVIARAGATNLAELAVQAKPCIIIPNPALTGGHQLKNTEALQAAGAIVQMSEEQIEQELRLAHAISELLEHPDAMRTLAKNLRSFARPDAAARLAELILALPARGGRSDARSTNESRTPQ